MAAADEANQARLAAKDAAEQKSFNDYYTKKDSQGKTQAQRDAAKNAIATAGIIRESSNTKSAYVNPGTGKVVLTSIKAPATPVKTQVTPVPTGVKTYTATDGTVFTDAQAYATYQASLNATATDKLKITQEANLAAEEKRRQGQSAYDLLFTQFAQYGMGALVEPLKQFIQDGISSSEFTLRLRDTDAYKKRFAANAARIAKGLSALNEAEYIGLEDQYQNIMRQYGLPASYYARGDMGRQEGFEKFIANDVSAAELEDRVMTAQDRLINASPEIMNQLKGFYNISDGDILSYILDPQNAINRIKRQVQASEIGAAQVGAGLKSNVQNAEALAAANVTGQMYQQAAPTIAEAALRGSELASFYNQDPYTQQTAEQLVLDVPGSAEALKKTKKLVGLEKATFSGQTGAAQGALGRERAGNI